MTQTQITEPTTETITTNLTANNHNLTVLKKHFGQCFTKDGSFDFDKFKQEISATANRKEDTLNFSKESYGIEWLGKSYARLLATDEASTLLRADPEHNAKAENASSQNLLLKGDNLEVLKHLSHAYYEKVKMIYIDPPYNTGSDGFVYADKRQFTAEQLEEMAGVSYEKAQQILSFTRSKSNSHSAWLTFMYPRLYIAKQLLREDGVIFVSIDDNEVAQLKLLMDEVFGEDNFVGQIPWRKRTAKSDVSFGVSQDYEVILGYGNIDFIASVQGKPRKYYETDDYPNRPWRVHDLTTQRNSTERPNSFFTLIDPKTQKKYPADPQRTWAVSKDTFQDYYDLGKIVFPDDYDFLSHKNPVMRYFKDDDMKKAGKNFGKIPLSTNLPETVGMSLHGTKEVTELFSSKIFSFPKPSSLIKYLLTASTNIQDNDLILDFFAGSGTTVDAVMQLNAEDGGNRQFICVQLPEIIDPKKNKTAYDFVQNELGVANPTIFDITKERIIRSAKKIQNDNAEAKQPKNLSQQDMGFKIFETLPIWQDYELEIEKFDEQMALFDQSKLSDDDLQALLTTWKTYDGSPLTQECLSYALNSGNLNTGNLNNAPEQDYTAYYVVSDAHAKLYLMHQGFSTAHLTDLLQKLDTDPDFNPTSIVAFGYHFDSKNLREMAENIASFANKKSSDIDFVVRY